MRLWDHRQASPADGDRYGDDDGFTTAVMGARFRETRSAWPRHKQRGQQYCRLRWFESIRFTTYLSTSGSRSLSIHGTQSYALG